MSITKPKKRINVSVSEAVEAAVASLAARDNVPQATKAAELLQFALELEEDAYFTQVATARLAEKSDWVSHADAWK